MGGFIWEEIEPKDFATSFALQNCCTRVTSAKTQKRH